MTRAVAIRQALKLGEELQQVVIGVHVHLSEKSAMLSTSPSFRSELQRGWNHLELRLLQLVHNCDGGFLPRSHVGNIWTEQGVEAQQDLFAMHHVFAIGDRKLAARRQVSGDLHDGVFDIREFEETDVFDGVRKTACYCGR